MALTRRWIKLGRLFMVAWLAFFIYPIAAFLTDRFSTDTRTYGLLLLLALGLIWTWFWTRIIAGPDRRFIVPSIVGATLILTCSRFAPLPSTAVSSSTRSSWRAPPSPGGVASQPSSSSQSWPRRSSSLAESR